MIVLLILWYVFTVNGWSVTALSVGMEIAIGIGITTAIIRNHRGG